MNFSQKILSHYLLLGIVLGICVPLEKIQPSEVLFTITKDNLETGLRGYPVGYCTTSHVHPVDGLSYVQLPIRQCISQSAEAVIFLLHQGRQGSVIEVENFAADLKKRSTCSSELIDQILTVPAKGSPMKMLSIAILLSGMLEGKQDYREDCLDLIAKIPQIAATVINHHAGWNSLRPPSPDLGYIENFTHMLNVPGGDPDSLNQVFTLFNILHYDHGGGNLSTFVAKAVASGLEDMHGSIASAINALAGPKHGGANLDCLKFLEEILAEIGPEGSASQVEAMICRRLANNELIFGFGHAVLRVEDQRAAILYEKAQEKFPGHPLVKIALLLRGVVPDILKKNPKIADPYANVDAISGALLSAGGFPFPEYYPVLFAMARTVGIANQIVYERCEARKGKGTPIVRPKYIYKSRESD